MALVLVAAVTVIVLFSRDFEDEHPSAPATAPPDSLQLSEEPQSGTEDGEGDETRGIVQLLFMGRLGNNLFEYAAARTLADRLGWPLSLDAAPGKRIKFSTLLMGPGMRCFPGVRPVGLSTAVRTDTLQTVPFRGIPAELADTTPRIIRMQDWYQNYHLFYSDRDRLRQVRAVFAFFVQVSASLYRAVTSKEFGRASTAAAINRPLSDLFFFLPPSLFPVSFSFSLHFLCFPPLSSLSFVLLLYSTMYLV